MEDEKLDNAAFQANCRAAVPREIDKAASASNDCLAPDHHVANSCSSEQSMDANPNGTLNESANRRSGSDIDCSASRPTATDHESRDDSETARNGSAATSDHHQSSTNENSVELRPPANEVPENEPANENKVHEKVNGFTSEPTIMSNGKLKRKDDQSSETRASSEESNSTKKICNKTPVSNSLSAVNNTNGKPGASSNSADSSSSKEPTRNGETPSDDNTETESNSDRSDSDDDLTEEENAWACSVCTYRNSSDAFKCQMCDVRKNFSSRKPRINPNALVEQVAKQQAQIQQEALRASALQKSSSSKSAEKCSSKDRSKASTNSAEKRRTLDLEPMSPTSSTSSSKSVKREKKETVSPHKEENGLDAKSASFTFRLKDVDRNNGVTKSITVGNVTVKITEFQLKRPDGDSLKKNGKKSTTPSKGKLS